MTALPRFLLAAALAVVAGCASIPELDAPSDAGPPLTTAVTPGPIDKPVEPPAQAQGKTTPDREVYGPSFMETEKKGDPVLASVDGRKIRASDLYQVFFMDNPMKTRDVVRNLVLYELVRKEAARLGIALKGEAVEALAEEMMQEQEGRIRLRIDESMPLSRFVQEQYGMEMEPYRLLIRQTAVFHLLLERCVRYMELGRRRLRLGIIVMEDRDEAETVLKKLVKGASFQVLAREKSIDPSGSLGGILPPLPVDMEYPIVVEARGLDPGQVSDLKEATFAGQKVFRIIKLVELIEPRDGSYAELRDSVEKSLEEDPLIIPDLVGYWQESLKERYSLKLEL